MNSLSHNYELISHKSDFSQFWFFFLIFILAIFKKIELNKLYCFHNWLIPNMHFENMIISIKSNRCKELINYALTFFCFFPICNLNRWKFDITFKHILNLGLAVFWIAHEAFKVSCDTLDGDSSSWCEWSVSRWSVWNCAKISRWAPDMFTVCASSRPVLTLSHSFLSYRLGTTGWIKKINCCDRRKKYISRPANHYLSDRA